VVIPVVSKKTRTGVLKIQVTLESGRERIEKLSSTVNASSRAKKDHLKRRNPLRPSLCIRTTGSTPTAPLAEEFETPCLGHVAKACTRYHITY